MTEYLDYGLRGTGYGCSACGPDVYCADDAGEDYGPEPDDVDEQLPTPVLPTLRDYPDEEPF